MNTFDLVVGSFMYGLQESIKFEGEMYMRACVCAAAWNRWVHRDRTFFLVCCVLLDIENLKQLLYTAV